MQQADGELYNNAWLSDDLALHDPASEQYTGASLEVFHARQARAGYSAVNSPSLPLQRIRKFPVHLRIDLADILRKHKRVDHRRILYMVGVE